MSCSRGYFAQGCVLHVGGVTARRCCDPNTGGRMLQNGGVWSMTRWWRPSLFVILDHICVRSPWFMIIMQVFLKHILLYVMVKYQQYLQVVLCKTQETLALILCELILCEQKHASIFRWNEGSDCLQSTCSKHARERE